MKLKNKDSVLITAGKDKGRKGKIIKIFSKENKVAIEGLNIVKKHVKPRKQGEKGQVIQVPRPIQISNVKLICPKCKKATRIGYKVEKKEGKLSKKRVCKKCNSTIL
jgi:large subunit ribosomal protein L24